MYLQPLLRDVFGKPNQFYPFPTPLNYSFLHFLLLLFSIYVWLLYFFPGVALARVGKVILFFWFLVTSLTQVDFCFYCHPACNLFFTVCLVLQYSLLFSISYSLALPTYLIIFYSLSNSSTPGFLFLNKKKFLCCLWNNLLFVLLCTCRVLRKYIAYSFSFQSNFVLKNYYYVLFLFFFKCIPNIRESNHDWSFSSLSY